MGKYKIIRFCMICREEIDISKREELLNPEKEKFVCDKCYKAIMRMRKWFEEDLIEE